MLVFRTTPSGRDESADASEEHPVQCVFLGCEHRLVEHLRLLAANAREHAEPIFTPWLDRNHRKLSGLRRAPEVVEEATKRLALRAASPERIRAMLGNYVIGDEPSELGAQRAIEAIVVVEGLVDAHCGLLGLALTPSIHADGQAPLAGFR